MTQIDLTTIKWTFEKGVISISEKDVPFATVYNVISPKGGQKVFNFSHSTGPEFDPTTKWIYKNEDNIQLAVCNDAKMAKLHKEIYLNSKRLK